MRNSRIYTDETLASFCESGEYFSLDARSLHYLRNVLRLKVDDELTLFNGDGLDYRAAVVAIDKKKIEVVVKQQLETAVSESPLYSKVLIGISRGDKMDYALQKSVELGVSEIQPLITERVNSYRGKDVLQKKHEHWCNIVISACEQCGRNRVPKVLETIRFDEALHHSNQDKSSLKLIFTLSGKPLPSIVLSNVASRPDHAGTETSQVCLLVGPEGGLSAAEIAAAERNGFVGVKLGPRVLRTETAPVVALGILQSLLGDYH